MRKHSQKCSSLTIIFTKTENIHQHPPPHLRYADLPQASNLEVANFGAEMNKVINAN